MTEPYDPLTYDNLMTGLVTHFEKQPRAALTQMPDVRGPGIYALFYIGAHQSYQPIAGSAKPIYVGKAVPPGSRKGIKVDESDPALRKRLELHAKSIDAAVNLRVRDFKYRYLILVPVWITVAERFLIDNYQPIWNVEIDGFGVKNPGGGRADSEASWWDTLHPGRPWVQALGLRQVKKLEEAQARVERFFRNGGS